MKVTLAVLYAVLVLVTVDLLETAAAATCCQTGTCDCEACNCSPGSEATCKPVVANPSLSVEVAGVLGCAGTFCSCEIVPGVSSTPSESDAPVAPSPDPGDPDDCVDLQTMQLARYSVRDHVHSKSVYRKVLCLGDACLTPGHYVVDKAGRFYTAYEFCAERPCWEQVTAVNSPRHGIYRYDIHFRDAAVTTSTDNSMKLAAYVVHFSPRFIRRLLERLQVP